MEGFSGRGSRFDFGVILRKLGKALHLWWMAGWLDGWMAGWRIFGVYSGIEVYSHSTIRWFVVRGVLLNNHLRLKLLRTVFI